MDFTLTFYEVINGLGTFFNLLSTSINDITGLNIGAIGELSLIGFMLGGGLTLFVGYTLTAWIIDILP